MFDKNFKYRFSDIAYKETDSLGWRLATMNGDSEFLREKCKQFNWFDYIVFKSGYCVKPIEEIMNYYPEPHMVHQTTNWIYWQDLDKWFVKEDEIIPYPLNTCEETDDINFSYAFETENSWNDIEVFEDIESIYVCTEINIKTKNQQEQAILKITELYNNFENFINNLKIRKFAICHIDEFTEYKFLAWEKDNKIRFLIQDYDCNSRSDDKYKDCYIPTVFDILIDKDKFYKNFDDFYFSLKAESQKIYENMAKQINPNQ